MNLFKFAGWYGIAYVVGLALIEILWHRRRGISYDWQESMVSVVDAFLRQGVYFLLGGSLLIWGAPWFQQFALADLPLKVDGEWQWLRVAGLFIGLEFFYYWLHRWDHEIRWLWATHAVHHSPNRMNFLTAERLGWTQNLSGAVLTLTPLLVIGFRVEDVLGMFAFNLLYQYWLHTEMIGKLGWFEWIFNTPSHHRVHHGSNPQYLDSNYGGVLIIFDRIFGTFVEEEEKVVFGLVTPLRSGNPIYVALHEWINIGRDVARHWRHPKRVLGYLFARPGWSHDGSRATSDDYKNGVHQLTTNERGHVAAKVAQ
jgi:sterol desaturase/sphingolipid hydroxylase (fatty acid hydroxylase superfamily)